MSAVPSVDAWNGQPLSSISGISKNIMFNILDVINAIKAELKKELPGEVSQYKMAPEMRDIKMSVDNNGELKQSGVLILLYLKQKKLHICFIKRPEYAGPHSGQISFPGGKFETGDTNLIGTALRESYEEVGVIEENVDVLGTLSQLLIPVSQMEVLPVVGYAETPPIFSINSKEVEYLLEISIDHFLDKTNNQTMILFFKNRQIKAPYYAYKNEKIWGATAMMLNEFLEVYKKVIQK